VFEQKLNVHFLNSIMKIYKPKLSALKALYY